MTITYPINLLPTFPGWTSGFSLRWRQEQSTLASGRILVKDLGSPLWTLRAATKPLSPNNLEYWRARLTALENGLQQFWAYPMSRCFPIAYPNGSWPTGGAFNGQAAVASINANRKAISVNALPPGFKISVGDYVSLAGDLHQVMEAATANGSGVTGEFEIRPHVWPAVTLPRDATFKQPACLMVIVPGSVSSDANLSGWGAITFQAIEARL